MKTTNVSKLFSVKRLLGLCLALALLAGAAVLSAQPAMAETKPTISKVKVKLPASHEALTYGKGFALAGIFETDVGKITKVSAYLAQGGVKRFIFEAKPAAKNYYVAATKGTNGKTLNDTFKFAKLDVGHWKFSMTVTAKNKTEVTNYTVTRNFLVAQKITASGGRYPGNSATLPQYEAFALAGVYKANAGLISKVTATIKDDGGSTVASYTCYPDAPSFDVRGTKNSAGKTLNEKLQFAKLKPGKHTLKITVTGDNESAWGKTATYTVTRSFVIVKADPTPDVTKHPTATPTKKPTSIPYPTATPKPPKQKVKVISSESYPAAGAKFQNTDKFAMKGEYEVNTGYIKSVLATLDNSSGQSVRYYSFMGKSYDDTFDVESTPDKNSGKSLASIMTFTKLPADNYTFELYITGSKGATYKVRRTFTIGSKPTFTEVTPFTAPATLTKGKDFTLKGKASIDVGKITDVTVTVRNNDKKNVLVSGFYYNKTGLKLKSIDVAARINKSFDFSKLPKGTYTYKVVIKAINGALTKNFTFSKTFTVK